MNESIYQNIIQLVDKDAVFLNEPMSKHTTFRVGGEAECLIQIASGDQLSKLVNYLNKIDKKYFILGNGSNLLVSDSGYDGIVIQIGPKMNKIEVIENKIRVQAGALLCKVAFLAGENGLTGMEFASGIPGTIGGAIVMNAGAYGGEMRQIVNSASVMNEDGELMELDCDTLEFGYRTSIIKNRPFVVEEVILDLKRGDKEAIKKYMDEMTAKRREKQPLEYASAGSTFKRPEGYFAGKLIMDAGMRGYRVGGAQISEKHCGFIINLGNATAADIMELILEVKERVKERFGVVLEPEVVRLGDF